MREQIIQPDLTRKERRLYPRAVVRLPAEIQMSGRNEWDSIELYDLSANSAGVRTSFPLLVQSELRLRSWLPAASGGDEHQFKVACLVVWSRSLGPSGTGPPFFSGVHFFDLQGEDLDRVRHYVWNLVLKIGSVDDAPDTRGPL